MPSFSEVLSNASSDELQIICRSITPFIAGNNPPQVLVIQPNDTALINVLTKYGIIDPITKNPTNSDFGEGKTFIQPSSGTSVNYIVPPSLDRLKQSNGDLSADIPGNKKSGFDGITALATDKLNKKSIDDFNKKVEEGYKNKTIIPRVIEDENGNETIVLTEYDPEETERQRQRTGNPNFPLQYKIITPPSPTIGTNNTSLGAAIAGQASGTIVTPFGSSASPLANLSGNLRTLETYDFPKNGQVSSITGMGLNAVAIKALNAAGQIGTQNYISFMSDNPNPTTWGGFTHLSKNFLIGIRSSINNLNALSYLYGAIIDFLSGEDPSDNIEKAIQYIYKEYVFVPIFTAVSDVVAKSVAFSSPNQPAGRGENIVSTRDRAEIKKSKPTEYKNIFGESSRGAVSKEKAIIASQKASEIRKSRISGRISSWIQLSVYLGIYIGLPLLEEQVEKRKEDKKREEEQDNLRKNAEAAADAGTLDQIGMAIQTEGRVFIDDGSTITARNPSTGKDEEISVPISIPQTSPSINPPMLPSSGDLDDPLANFGRDEPLIVIPTPNISKWPSVDIGGTRAPVAGIGPIVEVVPEEPSGWEKAWYTISEFIVDGVHAVENLIGETPENIQFVSYIEALKKTPGFIAGLFTSTEKVVELFDANFLEEVRKFFPKATSVISSAAEAAAAAAEKSKLIKFISQVPAKTYEFIGGVTFSVITIMITEPLQLGDSSLLSAYEKELENLENEIRSMSPIQPKDSNEALLSQTDLRNLRLRQIELLKNAIEREKEYQKTIKDRKNLHSVNTDIDLNSNAGLYKEVSVAKLEHDNTKAIVDSLVDLGNQFLTGTSPSPNVAISEINQDVSFVTNPNQIDPTKPWKNYDPYMNTPSTTEGCFPPYVVILTKDGYKKISELKIGDSVISFNESGLLEEDFVSTIFIHENKEIYRYYFEDNSFIDITKEHPVLIENNTFEKIGNLKIGSTLIDLSGNFIKIKSMEFLYNGLVYNIEVENNHTYIADNIRVHNKLSGPYKGRIAYNNMLSLWKEISNIEEDRIRYESWLNEQFPDAFKNGQNPNIIDYGTIPGTPETTGGSGGTGTPQQGPVVSPPYSGPPSGGGDEPIASIYDNSAVASPDYTAPLIPEYLSNPRG